MFETVNQKARLIRLPYSDKKTDRMLESISGSFER